jgi:hypothetical protein
MGVKEIMNADPFASQRNFLIRSADKFDATGPSAATVAANACRGFDVTQSPQDLRR